MSGSNRFRRSDVLPLVAATLQRRVVTLKPARLSTPVVVCAALLVLGAIQLQQFYSSLHSDTPFSIAVSHRLRNAVSTGQHTSVIDVGQIAAAHLFGIESAATPDEAPATELPLLLVGAVAETDPVKGSAIIKQDAAGQSRLYSVGDSLPGAAVLRAVYAERVTIERDGRLETLAIPHGPGTALFVGQLPRALVGDTSPDQQTLDTSPSELEKWARTGTGSGEMQAVTDGPTASMPGS